jgi:hypothetical protein
MKVRTEVQQAWQSLSSYERRMLRTFAQTIKALSWEDLHFDMSAYALRSYRKVVFKQRGRDSILRE